jgi:hypothetical protein
VDPLRAQLTAHYRARALTNATLALITSDRGRPSAIGSCAGRWRDGPSMPGPAQGTLRRTSHWSELDSAERPGIRRPGAAGCDTECARCYDAQRGRGGSRPGAVSSGSAGCSSTSSSTPSSASCCSEPGHDAHVEGTAHRDHCRPGVVVNPNQARSLLTAVGEEQPRGRRLVEAVLRDGRHR